MKKQRVAKERAAQIVRSWTVQNEVRGVLGRIAARTKDCVRCSEDEKGHHERDKGAQVPRWIMWREGACNEEF